MKFYRIAAPAALIAALAVAPASFAKPPVHNQTGGSATGGTGGSAAVGGQSASTLGLGATSTQNGQTASALGVGGSAASATGGKTMSRSGVHGNRNLNGQAMAMAHDRGTFAKSHTHCKDKAGQDVNCRTKTMAHQPGQKPVMSTTTSNNMVGPTH